MSTMSILILMGAGVSVVLPCVSGTARRIARRVAGVVVAIERDHHLFSLGLIVAAMLAAIVAAVVFGVAWLYHAVFLAGWG